MTERESLRQGELRGEFSPFCRLGGNILAELPSEAGAELPFHLLCEAGAHGGESCPDEEMGSVDLLGSL